MVGKRVEVNLCPQFIEICVPVASPDVFREGFAEIEKQIVEVVVRIAPAHITKVDHSGDHAIFRENVLAAEIRVDDDLFCVVDGVHQQIELASQGVGLFLTQVRDNRGHRTLETFPCFREGVTSRKQFGERSVGTKQVELAQKGRDPIGCRITFS